MNPGFVFLAAMLPMDPQPTAVSAPADAVALPVAIAADPVMNKWTGSVSVGATYTDGNTDTRGVNAGADGEYRREKDRTTLRAYWNYASQKTGGESQITTRKAGFTAKYDYFLSKQLYLFAIAGIETDTLADLDKRYYLGGGLGYQWKETDTFKWSSEAGVTYFKEEYRTQTDPDEKDYIAARLANNIGWQINDKVRFEQLAEAFPSLEDADDFYGKVDSKLKVNLTASMFGQLQHVLQYDNTPSGGSERMDNLVALSLGWGF